MKLKKMLAVVSALCMLCAVVPVLPESFQQSSVISASAEDMQTSGTWGRNIEWNYDSETHTMTFSGTGETMNLVVGEVPWTFSKDIQTAIFEEGITKINGDTFSGCTSLSEIVIPESVVDIDDGNIYSTPWFKAKQEENPLVIVNNILLDASEYSGDSLVVPDGVTIIRGGFNSELASITIPDSVTTIGYRAFNGTNLYKEKKEEDSLVIIDGFLVNGSACQGEVTIPDGVKGISDYAFEGSSMTSVTIPDSVKNIGKWAFCNCGNLTSVVIPGSVESIGEFAFRTYSLKNVTILDGVKSIGDYAFNGNSDLTSITIPESVTNIGNGTFSNTAWLKERQEENPLVIVNGILIDGTNCQGDVVIPDTVTSIGDNAFWHSKLTSVTVSDSVKNIKWGAFNACSELTSVILSESVESIEPYAFYPCKSLASITFKNPECKIFGLQECISNAYKGNFDGTIYGYENSTAQAYAEKYGYKFESLGSAPETTEPETKEISPGDADGSGKIDILDVIIINKAILGKEKLTDEQLKAIDFNHNGKPDAEDSLILMKYIAGLIPSLS